MAHPPPPPRFVTRSPPLTLPWYSYSNQVTTKIGQFLSPSLPPTRVEGQLFLGNREDAQDQARLRTLGITHILNTATNLPNYFIGSKHFTYLKLPLKDHPSEMIERYFITASDWIDRAVTQGKKVFIHCIAGGSRSVTIMLAYLMRFRGLRLREAWDVIQLRRPWIGPNEGFRLQLAEFELELFAESSVAGANFHGKRKWWSFYNWNVRASQVQRYRGRPTPCCFA